jgi:hypothetical protein
MLKCEFWSLSRTSLDINFFHICTLVTYGFWILGVSMGFQDFVAHFLDEVLS